MLGHAAFSRQFQLRCLCRAWPRKLSAARSSATGSGSNAPGSSSSSSSASTSTSTSASKMTIINTGAQYNNERTGTEQLGSHVWAKVFEDVPMNGHLQCNLGSAALAGAGADPAAGSAASSEGCGFDVQLFPTWSERCEIQYHAPASTGVADSDVFVAEQSGSRGQNISLCVSETTPGGSLGHAQDSARGVLKIFLPEHFCFSLTGDDVNIDIKDKLQGPVSVKVGRGDLLVNKIRGDLVELITGDGCINVTKVAEGEVRLAATQDIRAKTLLGPSVEILVTEDDGSVDLGAVYSRVIRVTTRAGSLLLHREKALRLFYCDGATFLTFERVLWLCRR